MIRSTMVFCVCVMACRLYGSWTTFNCACFSVALKKMFGVDVMDGERVRRLLANRWWVRELSGGSHFRLFGYLPTVGR